MWEFSFLDKMSFKYSSIKDYLQRWAIALKIHEIYDITEDESYFICRVILISIK